MGTGGGSKVPEQARCWRHQHKLYHTSQPRRLYAKLLKKKKSKKMLALPYIASFGHAKGFGEFQM